MTNNIIAAPDTYQNELYETERRIANMTRWEQPKPNSVSARILVTLIAKRDRLKAEPPLPMPALARDTRRWAPAQGKPVEPAWFPIGTLTHGAGEAIPDFLKRRT